jgi:hypothetical protein
MLPGLMNPKRMSASGGMESAMERMVRGLVGGAAIRPAVGAPPTTCCSPGYQGSQISAPTISASQSIARAASTARSGEGGGDLLS